MRHTRITIKTTPEARRGNTTGGGPSTTRMLSRIIPDEHVGRDCSPEYFFEIWAIKPTFQFGIPPLFRLPNEYEDRLTKVSQPVSQTLQFPPFFSQDSEFLNRPVAGGKRKRVAKKKKGPGQGSLFLFFPPFVTVLVAHRLSVAAVHLRF